MKNKAITLTTDGQVVMQACRSREPGIADSTLLILNRDQPTTCSTETRGAAAVYLKDSGQFIGLCWLLPDPLLMEGLELGRLKGTRIINKYARPL